MVNCHYGESADWWALCVCVHVLKLRSKSWLVNLPPLTYPPRKQGLTAGLIKGNQWFNKPNG